MTRMMLSERAPSASAVSPAPMALFSPCRLSTPTIRKFSSPNWALGSRMSREFGSNAAMLFIRLFLLVVHCQAPPVRTNARTANNAATERPA